MFHQGNYPSQTYELINPPSRNVLSNKLNGYQGSVPKNLRQERNVAQNQYITEQISNDPDHVQRHADLNLKMRNPLFHEFHYKKLVDPQYSIPQHKQDIESWQTKQKMQQQPDSLDIFTQNVNARQQNIDRANKGSNLMNYDFTKASAGGASLPTQPNELSTSMLPPQQYSAAHQPPQIPRQIGSPQQSLPLRTASMISLADYNNKNNNSEFQQQYPQRLPSQLGDIRTNNVNTNVPMSRQSNQSNARNNNMNNGFAQPNGIMVSQPNLNIPRSGSPDYASIQTQQVQQPPSQQQQYDNNNNNFPAPAPQASRQGQKFDNPQYQQFLQQQEQKLMNQFSQQADPQQQQQQNYPDSLAAQNNNNYAPSPLLQQQKQFQSPSSQQQYQQPTQDIYQSQQQQQQPDVQPRYSSSPSILNDKRMRKIYNPLVQKVSAVYEPRYGVDVQFNGYNREQFRNWEDKNNHYHNIVRSKNHQLGQYADYSTGNHEYGQKRF